MSTVTIQDAWMAKIKNALEGDELDFAVKYFKMGEGGWEEVESVKVPRDPDKTLTDLDCIENPSRYPTTSRFVYQKDLSETKIIHVSDRELSVQCLLDTTEANLDDDGGSPNFYEIGLFDNEDTMIAYGTFVVQIKNDRSALVNNINITFGV